MQKNYVWMAVAMLVPLGILIGLLVLAPRSGEPASNTQKSSGLSAAQARASRHTAANDRRKNAGIPSGQTVADSEPRPSDASDSKREKALEVDMFGKKLDAVAKKVIEERRIAGEIVMAGRPVPGAKVVMRRVSRTIADGVHDYASVAVDPPDGSEWTADTDAEGRFAFYGLEVGHYGLEAYTGGACGVDDMPVRGNSIPGDVSIELRPSGPLAGRVLAPDGKPVADASVYPTRIQYEKDTVALDPVPSVLLSVKTDADGAFRFPRLVVGRWQLAVRAAGYPDQTSDWLPTGDQPAEIRLNELAMAPEITGVMLDGTSFKLSDYRGKYVLLDFWATWCGPCRKEMPNVKAVYEEYKSDPRLVVVGMDLDPAAEDARKYVSNNGMGWTHVFLGDWTKTPVPNQYGVEGIPTLILVGHKGEVLARDLRGPAIREAVGKALGTPKQ